MVRILVTGATGNVGREVAAQLISAGVPVRAFVRDARTTRLPHEVEIATGDLSRPETLESALSGITTVFLVWPFLTSEGAPAVLSAIAGSARRLVYLSSSGVDDEAERQTDPINRLHADMERLIKASGLEWSILRAGTIASNALGWAGQIRQDGVVRGPGIAPTAVVHQADVAAVAARVLTGDGHVGATHVLTGPQVVSRADQVRLIGEAIGRPLRFEEVSVEAARERMLADGRPPALVEALLASTRRPRSDLVTSTVEQITGSPARTFRQWAADHADAFR
ncbi:NAD(P)H-binding protein [Microbispora hainanensis]|uniref:NAD-dependent epimerase/dehydratase family protein n=1 Tax=Microbispora hainanensis TaxID=568844 RepID=A0A544Z0R3_9ACTN|nr:NAD(P)H-binding protein [Microbispora hainanensis]TQS22565.1 NAD-dependent epimerase/dehydratase family protein [Microbispora hainanensis]